MNNKLCDFCKKHVNELVEYNSNGQDYNICKECLRKVQSCRCIRCGEPIADESLSIRGKCINCAQVEATNRERAKFEEEMDISYEVKQAYEEAKGDNILTFTNDDYEKWLTFDPDKRGFNIKEFKESILLRRIWIMTKLQAAGYTDVDTINENMTDIEDLIDENIHNIIGKHCKFSIFNGGNKSELYENIVIAHKNKVYLFSSDDDFK